MVLHKHNKHNNGNHSNHHASNNNSTTNSTSNHLNNNNHINNNANNVNQAFSTRAVSGIMLSSKFYIWRPFTRLSHSECCLAGKRRVSYCPKWFRHLYFSTRKLELTWVSCKRNASLIVRGKKIGPLFNSSEYLFMTARFYKRLFARSRRSR